MSSIQPIPQDLLRDWCQQAGGIEPWNEQVQHLGSQSYNTLIEEHARLTAKRDSSHALSSALLQSAKEMQNPDLSTLAISKYNEASVAHHYAHLVSQMMHYRLRELKNLH